MNLRKQLLDRITFHKPNEGGASTSESPDRHAPDYINAELIKKSWDAWDQQQRVEAPSPDVLYAEDDKEGGNISDLLGLTLIRIERDLHDEEIRFHAIDTRAGGRSRIFKMWYEPDCCASCSVEDIAGDFDDLIGTPVLMAEEVSSREPPEPRVGEDFYRDDSETWTFYKIATIKGGVTIRWYGSSNGYYSEVASFAEIVDEQAD
jgi:hypothetical protein